MTHSNLHTVAEVSAMIESGRILLLAGDEALLAQLPPGSWIGGTTANFITEDGGITDRSRILVDDISDLVEAVHIRRYDREQLKDLAAHYPQNGFTSIIIPGFSEVHASFAREVQSYPGVFNSALVGWVSGVSVAEIGSRQPKCFAGNGQPIDNEAVVMHASISTDREVRLDIINLFVQGKGDAIEFDTDGFATSGDCRVNGEVANFAAYIFEKGIDTQLPLVADYNGAMINVSIRAVDPETETVEFYAPVFAGVKYRFAEPVSDYNHAFGVQMPAEKVGTDVAFSCNCILNYVYAGLEGKRTGSFTGPVTFGEIAYMLLNQTLVYLTVSPIAVDAGPLAPHAVESRIHA